MRKQERLKLYEYLIQLDLEYLTLSKKRYTDPKDFGDTMYILGKIKQIQDTIHSFKDLLESVKLSPYHLQREFHAEHVEFSIKERELKKEIRELMEKDLAKFEKNYIESE